MIKDTSLTKPNERIINLGMPLGLAVRVRKNLTAHGVQTRLTIFVPFVAFCKNPGFGKFPRYVLPDFLKYICECPEMTPYNKLHNGKEIYFALSVCPP